MTDNKRDEQTPDVSLTYNRLGQLATVGDAAGTRTFEYDPATLNPTKEIINSAVTPNLYYREITRVYEPEPIFPLPGIVVGRLKSLKVGDSADDDRDYKSEYFYDTAGRMIRVRGPGLPAYGAVYNFNGTSGLLDRIDYNSGQYATVGMP